MVTTPPDADIVIRGARIYTVDEARPWAQAVAIRGDRISWVGDTSEAPNHVGLRTEVIDAGGRSVLPGIINGHNHVRLGSGETSLDLHGAATLEEVHRRLAVWLREHPDAEWIEANGLSYDAIPAGDRGRFRTRSERHDLCASEYTFASGAAPTLKPDPRPGSMGAAIEGQRHAVDAEAPRRARPAPARAEELFVEVLIRRSMPWNPTMPVTAPSDARRPDPH